MSDNIGGTSHPPVPDPASRSLAERLNIHPILYAFIVLLVIFVSYQIVGGFLTFLFVGSKVTAENVMLHRVFTMFGQILLILVPTLLFAWGIDRTFSGVFPWRFPRAGETIFAILSLFFLQEILQIYTVFQDNIPFPQEWQKVIDPAKQLVEQMFRLLVSTKNTPEFLFVILVVCFTPAIVEEMLFRGLVQGCFHRATSPVKAAVLSGLIFGVFHLNPFSIIPLIGLGIFFGILRHFSRSMILPMTMHFLNNLLAVVVNHFNLEDQLVAGNEEGVKLNTIMLLMQLVLAGILFTTTFVWYIRLAKSPVVEEHREA